MLSCELAVDNKLRTLVVHGWTSFLKIALFFWSYDERTSVRGTLFMTVFVLPDMGAFARASKKSQVTCGNTTIARQSAALSALNLFSIPGHPGAPLRSTPGFYLSCPLGLRIARCQTGHEDSSTGAEGASRQSPEAARPRIILKKGEPEGAEEKLREARDAGWWLLNRRFHSCSQKEVRRGGQGLRAM
jgi:hypothetical protein